jgi:hypothetical protein
VPPWPDGLAAMAARMAAVSEAAQAERLMLEFLILCDVYDLLPVSNVVLGMVEGNRDSGAAQQSFVFQEAVAVRDGAQGPHWSLVDPSQLAAYLTFLRAQIEQYTGKNPIKAVKRALSLASTLRLADFVDRSLDLLKSTGAASAVAEKRLAEIQAWATRSGDAGKVLLGKSRYNGSGSPSPASGDETEASATQIVRELLDHVKMLERAILGPGSVE